MEIAVTTEADLRRLYRELEACRSRELKFGLLPTQFHPPDRFGALLSRILRSASFFGAAVRAFGRFVSASRFELGSRRALPDQLRTAGRLR
jgi:hypothetical protein